MSEWNTWNFVRRAQLARLVETLNDVLTIIRLDPQCALAAYVEQVLQRAQHFADSAFTQAELVNFAHVVCDVLDRDGGVTWEFRPPPGSPSEGLHGTDNLHTFFRAAYEQAMQLRCRVRQHRDDIRAAAVNPPAHTPDAPSESN